jgi:proprotein convertase subtilisin/kexin type 5
MAGFFENFTTVAGACANGCEICQDTLECSYCLAGWFLYSDKQCYLTCPQRSLSNILLRLCQDCPYECASCASNGSCSSCDPLDNRVFAVSLQKCVPADSYFDNLTRVAVSCPAGCLTCSSSAACSSCINAYFLLTGGLCFSSCPQRYRANLGTKSCELCPYDCLSCDDSGRCLNCDATTDFRELLIETGRCTPLLGYYETGVSVATLCLLGCQSCQTATVCLFCSLGYFLLTDSSCSTSCPPRFFPDSSSNVCQPCPFDCLTCNSTGACLSCDETIDHRIFTVSTARCDPIPGYYQGTVVARRLLLQGGNVLKCPTNCLLCNSQAVCSHCNQNYYLMPDIFCYSSCAARFVANGVSGRCVPCPYDCYTCSINGKCLSCNTTTDFRELSQLTKRCIPLAGYFESFREASAACPSGCAECVSDKKCIFCQAGYLLNHSSLCSNTCADRYYPDLIIQECLACPHDCLTCNSLGECLSCSGILDFRLLSATSRRCVCNVGYFDNWTIACLPCPVGCARCLSSSFCISCIPSYYLFVDGLCYLICPDRYVGVNSTQKCSRCPYDCLSCTENGTCLSCSKDADHRSLFVSRCLVLPGYFDNGTSVGAPCLPKCTMCLNLKVCSACVQGYYLSIASTCEDICQPRFGQARDASGGLICTQCPYQCYQCDSAGNCTTCNAQLDHRVLNNYTLRCECLPGYYENRTVSCPSCPSGCATCSSPALCSSCSLGYFFLADACLLVCPQRFYGQSGSNTC